MKSRRSHILLLVLALTNMIPALEAEASWIIFGIAVACAVLSFILHRPGRGPPVSKTMVHVGVLASVVFLLYEMYGYHEDPTVHIIDIAHFMVFLNCCKFFELRTHRDAALVAMISFLLLIISAFVSASLMFGMVLAVDLSLGLVWLMSFQTQRQIDDVLARRERLTGAPATSEAESRVWQHRSLWRSAGGYGLLLAVFGVTIFVAVPRGWGRGLFGRIQQIAPVSTTGFDDDVRLHDADILESEEPVMQVRFSRDGERIMDDAFFPYMRGATFDVYEHGRWRHTAKTREFQMPVGSLKNPDNLFGNRGAPLPVALLRQEVWLDIVQGGHLFSSFVPVLFGSPDIRAIRQNADDQTLRALGKARGEVHYIVDSAAELSPGLIQIIENRARRRAFRREEPRHSRITPRVRDLAVQIATRIGDPTDPALQPEILDAFRNYLLSPAFTYTLEGRSLSARVDPIEDFLFETRQGHCEFFASAMTLMSQSIGIPARLVTGYAGGEPNHAGGFFQFRQKDAHAWVEVWLPDKGWSIYDPTPAQERTRRRQAAGLFAQARRFADLLQFRWSTFVVSFDEESRRDLAMAFDTWLAGLGEGGFAPKTLGDKVKAFFWGPELLQTWQRALYWLLLVLCVVFVVLLLRVLWILSLLLREYFAAGRTPGVTLRRLPEAKFYDRMLLLLAHRGRVKPPTATPLEFARRLAADHRDYEPLPEFTEWFYEVQYGGRQLPASRWERIRGFLQRLREDASFGGRS